MQQIKVHVVIMPDEVHHARRSKLPAAGRWCVIQPGLTAPMCRARSARAAKNRIASAVGASMRVLAAGCAARQQIRALGTRCHARRFLRTPHNATAEFAKQWRAVHAVCQRLRQRGLFDRQVPRQGLAGWLWSAQQAACSAPAAGSGAPGNFRQPQIACSTDVLPARAHPTRAAGGPRAEGRGEGSTRRVAASCSSKPFPRREQPLRRSSSAIKATAALKAAHSGLSSLTSDCSALSTLTTHFSRYPHTLRPRSNFILFQYLINMPTKVEMRLMCASEPLC